MLWEIDLHPRAGLPDLDADGVADDVIALRLAQKVRVASSRGYLVQGPELSPERIERLARELFADTVAEEYQLGQVSDAKLVAPPERISAGEGTQLVQVLLKPGVMDPVAQSAEAAVRDFGWEVDAVRTLRKYWIADASPAEVQAISTELLANDAIEQVVVGPLPFDRLQSGSDYKFELKTVAIRHLDAAGLARLSKEGQLYLQPAEMETIQRYFVELGREPTDIELETVAQTWSEHCSHKTLAGRIAYRDENGDRQFESMLKETIFAATQELRRRWGKDDWCVSVFKDNAGIVKFDDQYNIAFKVETHNHPSALEPYGGANTGIGGVIRDTIGTGLGAKPVCNTDVFCFAPPETPVEELPTGVLHPKLVMRGVVEGVRDYGNRMGIPTINGAVYFDRRYLGNPLVYCGNVGLIPCDKSFKEPQPGDLIVAVGGRTGRDGIHGATFSSAELTEESESLSGGAVQIGNAIEEKKVLDVLLEARDRNLFTAMTDCGAGGFSSAVGEMGEKIGAEVHLDKAPVKYAGLSYTELWISEAQERMVLSVPEAKWAELHQLCASEGVEATAIGTFEPTGRLVLKYNGNVVGDMPMSFLHDGRPPVVRQASYTPKATCSLTPVVEKGAAKKRSNLPVAIEYLASHSLQRQFIVNATKESYVVPQELINDAMAYVNDVVENRRGRNLSDTQTSALRDVEIAIRAFVEGKSEHLTNEDLVEIDPNWASIRSAALKLQTVIENTPEDHTDSLFAILGSLNVASKESIIRQYDHEVQGGSAIKPLVGVQCDGPGDAAVIRPVLSSRRGVVISCGMNPRYGDFDPYHMAASAIDEAVRNCVAVGADPARIAILDNFCWGDCERSETLGSLVRAAIACHDLSLILETPFISGKDSLNNEFSYFDDAGQKQTIAIPSSLLISAMGQVADVSQCVTMDLKQAGNLLYLVGETKDELGGSHYTLVNNLDGGAVPTVDGLRAKATFAAIHRAIGDGSIRSCHDLSEGGLAAAAAEMAFAGGLGVEVQLDAVPTGSATLSPTVKLFSESNTRFLCEVSPELAAVFEGQFSGLPVAKIGVVVEAPRVTIKAGGETLIDAANEQLKEAWQRPLRY